MQAPLPKGPVILPLLARVILGSEGACGVEPSRRGILPQQEARQKGILQYGVAMKDSKYNELKAITWGVALDWIAWSSWIGHTRVGVEEGTYNMVFPSPVPILDGVAQDPQVALPLTSIQ
ncbi:hypothetical protein B0H14DRAFT_2638253 [Mycena olivaceomarginata]|nr:hypothetical protein B0H14DRAFT_2638253 [Mycena olivaceomarginata]